MNNILEVKNLSKRYEAFTLNNISFAVPRGYIMGFIGHNGAGKTTTIKAILGMIANDGGEIAINGEPISAELVELKQDIGVVMDVPFYNEDWRVREVERIIAPFYKNWDSHRFAELLRGFGISSEKKVKELSRGMKVKLMLASALSHDAKLLILDEPTSGLDPVARDELMEILSEFVLDENKGVLFSTHITSDLEKIADYITFIIDGRIAYTGEKDRLMEYYVVVKGGLDELTREQRKLIIGYREHSVGFEGMARTEDIAKLPNSIATEKISLDEIIVFMNKEGSRYE